MYLQILMSAQLAPTTALLDRLAITCRVASGVSPLTAPPTTRRRPTRESHLNNLSATVGITRTSNEQTGHEPLQ